MSNKNTSVGKGDKQRPTDLNKFRNNYDDINWGNSKKKNELLEALKGIKTPEETIENFPDVCYDGSTTILNDEDAPYCDGASAIFYEKLKEKHE